MKAAKYGIKGDDASGFTFCIGGKKADLRDRQDGMHYLALSQGVYSNHLQDPHTYSVSDGTNTYTITASVLTYARSCALKTEKKVSDLGKALYLYSRAVFDAFEG